MGKRPTKCKKGCLDHRFILKPVNYRAYLSQQIRGDFCYHSETSNKYKNLKNKPKHCFPHFLNDKKCYTPAFTLQEDQNQYIENDRIYFVQHLQKVQSNLNSKSQIMQAKPKSKNDYCSVCKSCYSDYIQHIQSENHKNKINENKFNFYILQLCDKFPNQQFVQEKTINEETSFYAINSINQYTFKPFNHNKRDNQDSFECQNLNDLKRIKTQDTIILQEQKNDMKQSFSPMKKCVIPLFINNDFIEKNQLNTHFPPSPKKSSLFTDTEQKLKENYGNFWATSMIQNKIQKDQNEEKINAKHIKPIVINSGFNICDN